MNRKCLVVDKEETDISLTIIENLDIISDKANIVKKYLNTKTTKRLSEIKEIIEKRFQ